MSGRGAGAIGVAASARATAPAAALRGIVLLAFLLAAVALPAPARAFWDVQKSETDVFGNVNVTVTSFGDNGNILRFECGSGQVPFFAFLIRDGSGTIPDIPALFLFRAADGTRFEARAMLTSWNDRFVAVRLTDRSAVRRLAEQMVVATRRISVGVVIPILDLQVADTFSPRGSTRAGRTILDHCLD